MSTVTSLSLKKSLEGALVAGGEATYTIAVTDHGPSDAAGPITVTDELPSGLRYVSSSSADGLVCTAQGQLVTCTTAAGVGLAVGATITVAITVSVAASQAGGTLTNSATATSPTRGAGGKSATASGSASATVAGPTVVPPAHTGEPWSSPWWWATTALSAFAGLVVLAARRRHAH